MPTTQTYSTKGSDGRTWIWDVERLVRLARHLPVRKVPVAKIAELDQVMWFGGPRNVQATCKEVAQHAKRLQETTLDHAIILSSSGRVMDGMHRATKAWMVGITEIDAVQFEEDPAPDEKRGPVP